MSAESLSRGVRAAFFAAVCVSLAATGHVMMSGSGVPPGALAAAVLLIGAGAWAAAGRQRGPLAITGGLLAAQAALHNLFSWTQHGATPMAVPGAGLQAQWLDRLLCGVPQGSAAQGIGLSAARLLQDAALDPAPAHQPQAAVLGPGSGMTHGVMAMHSAAAHGAHDTRGMLAAHALAAVICGLWLWRGEAALFRSLHCLGAWAAGSLAFLVRWFVPIPVRRPGPWAGLRTDVPVARLRETLLCHVLSRRGPPREPACC